jgi:hypothetical protein
LAFHWVSPYLSTYSYKEGRYIKDLVDMSQIYSGEKRDQSRGRKGERIFDAGKPAVDPSPPRSATFYLDFATLY